MLTEELRQKRVDGTRFFSTRWKQNSELDFTKLQQAMKAIFIYI
jgi:hypothetical protein